LTRFKNCPYQALSGPVVLYAKPITQSPRLLAGALSYVLSCAYFELLLWNSLGESKHELLIPEIITYSRRFDAGVIILGIFQAVSLMMVK
jgi:hypothetical protein